MTEKLPEDPTSFPSFPIERFEVVAKERTLKAEWSLEQADALLAYSPEEIEEWTQMLSKEILEEMNREIIRSLYDMPDYYLLGFPVKNM